MRILVHRAGLLTTVQDSGRWGFQAFGVPVSGPMDGWSHRLANLLAGNDASMATLEVTGVGPELVFDGRAVLAVAGAEFSGWLDGRAWTAPAVLEASHGSHLAFGERGRGMRAYVALSGGVDTPLVLGSRATDLRGRFGGLDGRALRSGDTLLVGEPPGRAPRWPISAPAAALPDAGVCALRVIPGPDGERGHMAAFDALTGGVFTLSSHSDRMGYRLTGVPVILAARQRLSEPVATGIIQIPPSGDPILLMVDRQTTGGYPAIAAVIAADLPLAGQLAPGDRVRFERCDAEGALAALIAREQPLLALERS